MNTSSIQDTAHQETEHTWAVTLKLLRTDSLRIVSVRASSISRAIAKVLEATRPKDPGTFPPAQQLVRCVNCTADEISFHGLRIHGEATATMAVNHQVTPLPLRLDLGNHSPTGFEWGYEGSGPAQLSLAICTQLLGDDRALQCYQGVKAKIFAHLHRDAWTLQASVIQRAAEEVLAQRN